MLHDLQASKNSLHGHWISSFLELPSSSKKKIMLDQREKKIINAYAKHFEN